MRVSVIIVTYNRPNDLKECLNSILMQTYWPLEVVIVDNGNIKDSAEIVENIREAFQKTNIALKYIKNEKENSLTIGRNIGVENSIGEIILFLDDDMVLEKNYLEEIIRVYEKYPQSMGVQGYIVPLKKRSKFKNLICKIFYFSHYQKNKCNVLPSIYSIYPSSIDKVIQCQWLSGANQSWRKEIFKEFRFDENLKKYSEGEDIDFSYRVFKKYPNSLFMSPFARLIHKTSPEGRLPQKELVTMEEVYSLYIFYKNFERNLKNKLIYLWSRIGKLIFSIISPIFKLKASRFVKSLYLIESYLYCIRHIKDIKKGNLDFFNKFLE